MIPSSSSQIASDSGNFTRYFRFGHWAGFRLEGATPGAATGGASDLDTFTRCFRFGHLRQERGGDISALWNFHFSFIIHEVSAARERPLELTLQLQGTVQLQEPE